MELLIIIKQKYTKYVRCTGGDSRLSGRKEEAFAIQTLS